MYKHAMLRMLQEYGAAKEIQPLLENQIEGLKMKVDHSTDNSLVSVQNRQSTLQRLERNHAANKSFMADIEYCFKVLTDREYCVIYHFYIHRTWDYIEIINEKLGIERSQIYRIKDKAMKKLVMAYYGRRA